MRRNMPSLALATLGVAGMALGGAVGCRAPEEAPEPVVRPVRWLEVQPAPATRSRSFTGTARAGLESQLSFRIGGTVEHVGVVVGDDVRRGEEIARLDDTDARLRIKQAEASLDQARAARRKAEADYDRVRGLYENSNASKSDLDAARAQAESARSRVEAAEQALALARRELGYSRLLVPVDGAIASVTVEENENVQPGQTIALLTSGERPEVEIGMPEQVISQVREGESAEVAFDALPGTVFPATVTEVGVATTRASTYPVKVRLDVEDGSIRSGMAATVSFRFAEGDGETRWVLPPVAVGEDRDGRFVFRLESGDDDLWTARRHPVVVGDLTADGLEIVEGIETGDRVATAGLRRLLDGQAVRLLE